MNYTTSDIYNIIVAKEDTSMTLDIIDASQAMGLAIKLNRYAEEYKIAKEKSAKAKHSLDIIMASNMIKIRGINNKQHVGYETSIIGILEIGGEEVKEYYKDYIENDAKAKGLERVLSALETQISLFQSIAKIQPK